MGDGLLVDGEKISFDDLEYGSLAQGLAMSFQRQRQGNKKHRRDRRRRHRQIPDIQVTGGVDTIHEFVFQTPLSNPNAARESRSGLLFPCDDEVKAVVGKIAEAFGGTVNTSKSSFQIDLPTTSISYDTMEQVMKGLGFKEFFNTNPFDHTPTFNFGFGAYHWEGNVLGNWYHLNFPRTGYRSSQVTLAKDLHYHADRPDYWDRYTYPFHRVPNARNEREPCP